MSNKKMVEHILKFLFRNSASRRIYRSLLVLVLITGWIFSGWPNIQIAEAVSTETFTTSTTWTAPAGVTSVTAEVWGGGGGGGGGTATTDGGGGGGGGAYSIKAGIVVVPATGYTVTVGGAGTGSAGCTASTVGGDSWFSTTGTILAKGGSPGACSTGTPPAGGLGGVAASGVGDTKFNGGQGEKGRNNNAGLGGYGGSSAGTAANGFSGPQTWSTATYPTASTPTGGGHGGDGGATANAAGSAPASGNGGGGGGAADGTNISGGNGAVGKVILTYNKPPNAPSQDSPANSATGVSVTPTFLMTATDADTTVDNLGYKVTIYSNSACTTVVQTNDQAVSSTGWTGSNATCTAAPTACYTSGTQGSFLTQTALTASTQYWWKASAKDPDGNGSFTDSSTCNTFTTGAAQTLTFSLGATSLALGTLSSGAVTSGSHTLTVGTNAANGVAVTYSGATLTSGGNTITAMSTAAASSVGTEQFGINAKDNVTPNVGLECSGTPTIAAAATGYATVDNFKFVSGETVVSSAGSINDTTCTISYIANITAATEAGSYTTILTYIATGNF